MFIIIDFGIVAVIYVILYFFLFVSAAFGMSSVTMFLGKNVITVSNWYVSIFLILGFLFTYFFGIDESRFSRRKKVVISIIDSVISLLGFSPIYLGIFLYLVPAFYVSRSSILSSLGTLFISLVFTIIVCIILLIFLAHAYVIEDNINADNYITYFLAKIVCMIISLFLMYLLISWIINSDFSTEIFTEIYGNRIADMISKIFMSI